MIATGGLLRINARRQDSLRSKPRVKPKKPGKKRRQEVVVVPGRIQVCSVSGLVAVLGLLILMVGGVLAAVGYCPQDLLFKERPSGGVNNSSAATQVELVEGFNSSHNSSLSLIQALLQRFLDSDRLKVFGPLVMGVGIFLFLCANAVLHENRDKKTKVIKLQDIYSTVIDLHQTRDRTRDRTGDQTRDPTRDQTRDRTEDWTRSQTRILSQKLAQSPDQSRQNHNTTAELWERVNGDIHSDTKWPPRKGGSVKEKREEIREQGCQEGGGKEGRDKEGGNEGAQAKWWTRRGCSLKERGDNETGGKGAQTKWWTRKGGSVRERREETREQGGKDGEEKELGNEERENKGTQSKWWTRRGCSLKERGDKEIGGKEIGYEGALTKWWTRKGGSVRERREETTEQGGKWKGAEDKGDKERGDKERGDKGAQTKWWRRGGSMREGREGQREREVFSVFHEQWVGGACMGRSLGYSLPHGFSLHRVPSQKCQRPITDGEMKVTNQSAEQELDTANESVELELDTSFSLIGSRSFSCSLIGSQRPLLMMSRSSLSPTAHANPLSNQRRGSMLSHAPCMSPANRRSSCI
ncbi:hypothetical protein NQD34_014752 [Periophthalmus magnuspinnatus]|nr:hypothetical protein NQD34_014752 [Periophthalmus magnuspinnatus]